MVLGVDGGGCWSELVTLETWCRQALYLCCVRVRGCVRDSVSFIWYVEERDLVIHHGARIIYISVDMISLRTIHHGTWWREP